MARNSHKIQITLTGFDLYDILLKAKVFPNYTGEQLSEAINQIVLAAPKAAFSTPDCTLTIRQGNNLIAEAYNFDYEANGASESLAVLVALHHQGILAIQSINGVSLLPAGTASRV